MDHKITLTAALLVLLAGCSSSSDEDCIAFGNCPDGAPVGVGGTGLAIIDRDNALVILREAWFAASTTSEIPPFVVATGVGDTSGGIAQSPGNAAKIAMRNWVSFTPFGPETYNCPTSGTFTVSGDVTDPNTVTTDDFAIYEAISCDSGTGYTVDGTFRFDIGGIVGDPASGQYEQDQLLTFTGFQAASASLTTTLNGDHTAVIDSRPTGQILVTFGGNSLRIDEEQISISISNYSGVLIVQTSIPFNNTLAVAGTVNSSLVAGSFDFVTGEAINKPVGLPPTDGILDVIGEGGSTARVAVVNETLVRIEVDANGSGNYEVSSSVSWQEFLNGNLVLNWGETGLN
jgi:hypothetical protein